MFRYQILVQNGFRTSGGTDFRPYMTFLVTSGNFKENRKVNPKSTLCHFRKIFEDAHITPEVDGNMILSQKYVFQVPKSLLHTYNDVIQPLYQLLSKIEKS